MSLVYKILSREEWAQAERDGVFHGSEVDRRDGYIHLSAADQLERTISLWFAGRDDLVLVAIEAERLVDALKWEPSRGGALFPHYYAPLAVASVSFTKIFSSRNADEVKALVGGVE